MSLRRCPQLRFEISLTPSTSMYRLMRIPDFYKEVGDLFVFLPKMFRLDRSIELDVPR